MIAPSGFILCRRHKGRTNQAMMSSTVCRLTSPRCLATSPPGLPAPALSADRPSSARQAGPLSRGARGSKSRRRRMPKPKMKSHGDTKAQRNTNGNIRNSGQAGNHKGCPYTTRRGQDLPAGRQVPSIPGTSHPYPITTSSATGFSLPLS